MDVEATEPVGEVLDWLGDAARTVPVERRSARVGDTLSSLAGAAAWWLSVADLIEGALRAVACDSTREPERTDGEWAAVTIDQTVYELGYFPSTQGRLPRHGRQRRSGDERSRMAARAVQRLADRRPAVMAAAAQRPDRARAAQPRNG